MELRRRETQKNQTSGSFTASSRSSKNCKNPPLTSAERVALFRKRQKNKVGYNHEEHKRSEALRIAAIRAKKQKCPLGRKCKDLSCNLHPDRGRVRPERQASQTRSEAGKALMKKNRKTDKKKVESLNLKVSSLINEKRRLKRKLDKLEGKGHCTPTQDLDSSLDSLSPDSSAASLGTDSSATSFLLSSMSPLSKKKTLKRAATTPGFTPIKKSMRNDLNIQLRTERIFTEDEIYLSDLAEKVVKFMMQDDNSFCCPDKDKENVRFRRDTLEVLHHKFMCEEMIDCSYRSFCRYVPDIIKKPKPEDWGTSLCKTCLNPELKLEGLKVSSIDSSGITLEGLLALPSSEYAVLRERFKGSTLVTFKEWQKEKSKKKAKSKTTGATVEAKSYRSTRVVRTVTGSAFIDMLLQDIRNLKAHTERKIAQFRRIKEIRNIVADPANKAAAIRMDWSENATLFQCRQEKSSYYHDIQVSVNTTVIYTAEGTKCAGSISDVKDHTKAAVWASLKSIMAAAEIDTKDIELLFLITDSPTSQYRNAGCAFLAKRFAEREHLELTWVFTESGHGKGPMDGVGAAIKNAIDDAAVASESMPDAAFTSSADVIPLLQLPNVVISTYGDADVATEKGMIPNNISLSWKKFGISKIHEMLLEKSPSNSVLWKMMPSDPQFAKALLVTQVRKRKLGKQKDVTEQQPIATVETPSPEESEESSNYSDGESEEDSEDNEEEATDSLSEAAVATNLKPLPDISFIPMDFEDVMVNLWVAVSYGEKTFLGRVLRKAAGEYLVKCLNQPYGTRQAQEFEKDAIFYQEVFPCPIQPWQTDIDDQGKRTRKTVFKY